MNQVQFRPTYRCVCLPKKGRTDAEPPLQQDDNVKQFFMDIGKFGLRYAWAKYFMEKEKADDFKWQDIYFIPFIFVLCLNANAH